MVCYRQGCHKGCHKTRTTDSVAGHSIQRSIKKHYVTISHDPTQLHHIETHRSLGNDNDNDCFLCTCGILYNCHERYPRGTLIAYHIRYGRMDGFAPQYISQYIYWSANKCRLALWLFAHTPHTKSDRIASRRTASPRDVPLHYALTSKHTAPFFAPVFYQRTNCLEQQAS